MNRLASIIFNKTRHIDLIQRISVDSAIRMQKVLVLLGVFQFVQLILYLINPTIDAAEIYIIIIKVIAIFLCLVSWFLFQQLIKGNKKVIDRAEGVTVLVAIVMLLWAILNTLYAQYITSDMSIYLLVVFASVAVIRIRPLLSVLIYGFGYIIFAAAMPYFQKNQTYLQAHLINGFILTLVAITISIMFYRYAIGDYFVRKQVHNKTLEVKYLGEMDMLTDLYNHHYIYEVLHKAVDEKRGLVLGTYLFLMDIDDFSEINEQYGHRFGNEVLRHVGKILKNNIKNGDKDIAARYGNDEFLFVMKETDVAEARRRIIRIREELLNFNLHGCKITFSGGLAKWEYESADEFIRKVEKLCLISKNNGKNQVTGSYNTGNNSP